MSAKWHECPRCKFWFECFESTSSRDRPDSPQTDIKNEPYFDSESNTAETDECFPTEESDLSEFKEIGTKRRVKSRSSKKRKNLTNDQSNKSPKKGKLVDRSLAAQDKSVDVKPSLISIPPRTFRSRRYQCVTCDRRFHNQQELDEHTSQTGNAKCQKEANLECFACGEQFDSKKSLNGHVTTHELDEVFKCIKCSKEFSSLKGLKDHARKIHTVTTNYSCTECNKSFRYNTQLYNHMRSAHSEVRAYTCAICSKSFKFRALLARHIRAMHDLAQDCCICGQSFNDKKSLAKHMTIHKDEEIFKCIKCQKEFAVLRNLKEHAMRHSDVDQFIISSEYDFDENIDDQIKDELDSPTPRIEDLENIVPETSALDSANEVENNKEDKNATGDNGSQEQLLTIGTELAKCSSCSKQFKTKAVLAMHIKHVHSKKLSHRQKKFSCANCERSFKTKTELDLHVSQNQSTKCKKQTFKCCVCGDVLNSLQLRYKHEQQQHGGDTLFKCRDCDMSFPMLNRLRAHTLSCHDSSKNFHCPLCELAFKCKSSLTKHMRNSHKDYKPCLCKHCGKYYRTEHDLKTHIKASHETPDNAFICAECGISYKSKIGLLHHMKKHRTEYPFPCRLCPFKTHYKKTLEEHFERSHPQELPYVCNYCSDGFSMESRLRDHLRMVHSCVDVSEDWHCCNVCHAKFCFRHQLEIHMRTHKSDAPGSISCAQCGKDFRFKSQLLHHSVIHGNKAEGKTLECNTCGKLFADKSKLIRHQLVHSNEKPFLCREIGCNRAFKTESYLLEHMKRHRGEVEKPYACTLCEKKFPKKQHLEVHLRIHTGERPYKCGQCNYTAVTNGNLRKHERTVHQAKQQSGVQRQGAGVIENPGGQVEQHVLHEAQGLQQAGHDGLVPGLTPGGVIVHPQAGIQYPVMQQIKGPIVVPGNTSDTISQMLPLGVPLNVRAQPDDSKDVSLNVSQIIQQPIPQNIPIYSVPNNAPLQSYVPPKPGENLHMLLTVQQALQSLEKTTKP